MATMPSFRMQSLSQGAVFGTSPLIAKALRKGRASNAGNAGAKGIMLRVSFPRAVSLVAQTVAEDIACNPLSTTNVSRFFSIGKTPIDLLADETINAGSEGVSATSLNVRMIRDFLLAVLMMSMALFGHATASAAAEHSIGSSSLGLKVASFLRRSGMSDEAIVVAIASLPALELRGAIPVGYWMKLTPLTTYILAVVGNMLPVPFIALYLGKFFNSVASSSEGGKKLVEKILTNTRRKAQPIEEFKWIGLMLFVAVPFPGTGAWTGAFAASILGMSFWESMSANFVGVLMAGVLVNVVVSVGIREALFVGLVLFLLSVFMWRILRFFSSKKSSDA